MDSSENFERAVPKIRDYSNTRIRDGSGSRLNKSNSETNPYFHLSNEPYSNICNHNVGLKLKARNKSLDRYSSFEQDVCSEENDTIKIPGSSKVYHYIESASFAKIEYPDIVMPPSAEKESMYEYLLPQIAYETRSSQRMPLLQYSDASPVMFSNEDHFWNKKSDELNMDIAYNIDQLQSIANKWSSVLNDEERSKQNEVSVNENVSKEKPNDEQKCRRSMIGNGKPRPTFRSKTETRVSEATEQPKKRLGFFTRKKSDLESMRKQFAHLQTDSE